MRPELVKLCRVLNSPLPQDDPHIGDAEETNTVVENDCEDDFNLLDSQVNDKEFGV
jgi:hypothetical protein